MLRTPVLLHLLGAACLCSVSLSSFISISPRRTYRAHCSKSREARSTNDDASWRRHPLTPLSPFSNERPRSSRTAETGAETIYGTDRLEFLRQVQAGLGLCSVLSISAGGPQGAAGFCGQPYPYWAYYIDFDEVLIPFDFQGYSGRLFARTVGNAKDQKKTNHNPLVVIPGGPGLPHDYLETLEGASKDDRVVVLFDPVGTGNSSALPADVRSSAPDLLSVSSLVAQTSAVLDYLKINTYHLLGHGTGAAATLELGRSFGGSVLRTPGPKAETILSVTLASPVLDGSVLPTDFLESIRTPSSAAGENEAPPQAPLCLETAVKGQSMDSFVGYIAGMKKQTGSSVSARVGSLSCPVLITYGGRDVIGEEAVAKLKEALSEGDAPSIEVKRFEDSGHLAHLDQREEYVTVVQNFVTAVDKDWASTRAGKRN